MLELNAVGLDFAAAIETMALRSPEAVRTLADRVLEDTGGQLKDDATVLFLDWHGGHGGDRDSLCGAERKCTSEPFA